MIKKGMLLSWLLLASMVSGFSMNGTKEKEFDVVIVGGSSGAFGAAIGAARSGATVVLIEDTPVLGGMISNGISNIDCFSYESLSGVFDEFRLAVKDYYQPIVATDPIFKYRMGQVRPEGSFSDEERRLRNSNPPERRARQTNEAIHGGRWEPHVADLILKKMASSYPNLSIYYNRHATGVVKRENRVVGVTTTGQDFGDMTFHGKVVIDATHEADVAAWSGAPYRVGREARSPEEPHAGEIYYYNATGEIIRKGSGRQDLAIPSYGIRLCIKYYDPAKSKKHLLKSPPPGYDPEKYRHSIYGSPDSFEASMPSMKTEMNKNPIGNELPRVNWSWPEASYQERREMYEFYKNHALGFLYYLQHERGVKNIGLPDDEFLDNDNIPYRVFVREARRIEGEVILTEKDINPFIQVNSTLTTPFQKESVAIGHYPIDAKPVQQKVDLSTPDKGEGDFFLSNVISPFQIPYKALLPKNVEGLIVPVAISATHVAFSAIRMDATWMAMGQAAGVAAGISVKKKIPIREVDVSEIQQELLRQKARLVFYWDVPLDHPYFKAVQHASLAAWVDSDFDRNFYPDSSLTRGQAAQWIVRAFNLWPSVSNVHFSDVDIRHPAFQAIETLFDHGMLEAIGVKPRWPESGGYNGHKDGFATGKSNFGRFQPDVAISREDFHSLVVSLLEEKGRSKEAATWRSKKRSSEGLSRAEALAELWDLVGRVEVE
jgi:hypothetical protein